MSEVSEAERSYLLALADNFRALNGGGEGEGFLSVLTGIWGVDVDDPDEIEEFMYRLGITLLMVSDAWREHGIPDVQTRWAEK